MSQHTRSPTILSSSSTFIVSPFPLVHHLNGHDLLPAKKKPDLKLDITSSSVDIDSKMSGKGFIEPHRNNLPRRKRRVVTAPMDGAAATAPKTLSHTLLPTSEAGPRSSTETSYPENHQRDGTTIATPGHMTVTPIHPPPIQANSYASSSSSSSSVDTNITEPPSSPRASPTPSAPLHKSPALSGSSLTTFPVLKRARFHGHRLDGASLLVTGSSPPPITPTKGHLQPTSATLPRRHRSLVLSIAREEEQRRRSITEQQAAVQNQKPNDAWKEVGGQMIRQMRVGDADTVMMTNSESQSMRRIQCMCSQELARGLTLGFLTDGDEHDENVVRIKVYDDLTTPLSFSSLIPSSSLPGSPSPMPAPFSSSELHLQLSLPTHSISHIDGTTSLTDSQIQQACTFIDEHISILPESSNTTTTTRPGQASILILTPRTRPEEAMSIGISYLAGMEKKDKDEEETEGSDDHDDHHHTYSTVHRLLMAFHDDDPGSPIPNRSIKPDVIDLIWGGLRPEWRGVLSFDGMQRLDEVWTSTRRELNVEY